MAFRRVSYALESLPAFESIVEKLTAVNVLAIAVTTVCDSF